MKALLRWAVWMASRWLEASGPDGPGGPGGRSRAVSGGHSTQVAAAYHRSQDDVLTATTQASLLATSSRTVVHAVARVRDGRFTCHRYRL